VKTPTHYHLTRALDERYRNSVDYDEDGLMRLTKSQEESGQIALYCFLVALSAGCIAMGLWAFGVRW
jgi:hypothetical protein